MAGAAARPRNARPHLEHAAPGSGQKRMWLQRLQLEMGGSFTFVSDESKDAFTMNGERFVITALIGEGSFGSVYRCTREVGINSGTEQECAVKIVSTERICVMNGCSEEVVVARALHEAELLSSVGGHPHIVQLHCTGVSKTSLRIYMVMQYIDGTDLFTDMLQRRRPFSENDARKVFTQLLMAVAHCHRRGVAHRNIKLENLMLACPQDCIVKLIDFGHARHVVESTPMHRLHSSAKSLSTTSLYVPPDVRRAIQDDGEYDLFKLDSFGAGIVLYVMLCSALPDVAEGREYEQHPKWRHLSFDARDLINHLLQPDSTLRYSVGDALQHPWLTSLPSRPNSSMASTPRDYDAELQLLFAAQSLTTALQRERGATCWMICSGKESECQLDWFRKATDACFEKLQDDLQTDAFGEQERKVKELEIETRQLRELLRLPEDNLEPSQTRVPHSEMPDFETMFGGYSKLTEGAIDIIGGICVAVESPGTELPSRPSFAWLQIRTLLLVAEQLGRERAFISGHVGMPDAIFSSRVLVRFAKIQGCRQYLLGSSSPAAQCEIVSTEAGLLPRLRLLERPLLDIEDLKVLENAEAAVFEGRALASEWFALLTGMIDKVHQHARIAIVNFIQELGCRTRNTSPVTNTSFEAKLEQYSAAASPVTPSVSSSCFAGSTPSQDVSHTPALLEVCQQEKETQVEAMKPMKVMTPLGPPETSPEYQKTDISSPYPMAPAFMTPESTPLHPGLWQAAMPSTALLRARLEEPPVLQSSALQQPVSVPIPQVPGKVFQSLDNPSKRKDVTISKGTIGHPNACRGLGCKFAHKERGCKEGVNCLRCHMCVWQRGPEMAASKRMAASVTSPTSAMSL
eukprot:TRINITY_DN17656_c0_g2_i1.p1 TRINITY_DN17656_c0_g2~~TRINITY_DN17656_c0_g2_i1.p1  ORF type:complete len:879 (+),score=145.57 TRINITY_DN17656_c0_g2_i1:64-2637(+)